MRPISPVAPIASSAPVRRRFQPNQRPYTVIILDDQAAAIYTGPATQGQAREILALLKKSAQGPVS